MHRRAVWIFLAVLCVSGLKAQSADRPIQVRIAPGGQFMVDGKYVFPIGFTSGPPIDAKTPDGNNGFAELAKNGFVFFQWLTRGRPWGPATQSDLDSLMQAANQHGIKIAVSIRDLSKIAPGDEQKVAALSKVIERYRDNPATFLWKGVDEPQWGKVPVEYLAPFRDTVHQLDHNHLVWVTQAPRGTLPEMLPYRPYYDVGAVDIYPVSYPPGMDSGLIPNQNISVVGDYATRMSQVDGNEKSLIMTLQICFSGVAKLGRTLRFPTYPEQRYMSYQAIIDGAHALIYFGGDIPQSLSDADRPYGWNWSYYRRVLEPVLEEFRPQSPLYPALIAPNSSLPIQVKGGAGLEYTVREAGDFIYILASKREGDTFNFTFSGLPKGIRDGEVLFESPRHVAVQDGSFQDWFGPYEVHVYRFKKNN